MSNPPKEDINTAFARLTNEYKAKKLSLAEYRKQVTELVAPHKKRLEEMAAVIAAHDPAQGRTR